MTDQSQLWEIVGRYVDGAATADEVRKLEAALRNDAALRREFVRYMHIDAGLAGSRESLLHAPIAAATRPLRASRVTRFATAGGILLIAASLVAFYLQSATNRNRAFVTAAQTASPFAVLAAENNALWSDPNTELALRGGELPPGMLKLEAGTAEFLCADGATLLMRGPAALQFLERKRVFVEQGRVFCRCPSPESRLAIATSATEIIDLGTEFSVEARADRSTLVAVLSGEVQVGNRPPRFVKKGEAVEVRGDGLLVIQPLDREEFAELLLAAPTVHAAMQQGTNLLRDPGFESELGTGNWSGTEANLAIAPHGGRSGSALRVHANGVAHWPLGQQRIEQPSLAGRLVVATAWAAPDKQPLRARQTAMLKIVFVNAEGREFAFARRCFLDPRAEENRFEPAQVAAFVPAGTASLRLQLLFKTNLQDAGAVLFDDASLVIADP